MSKRVNGEGSRTLKPATDTPDDMLRPRDTDKSESSRRKLCSAHCERPLRVVSENQRSDQVTSGESGFDSV